MLKKGEVSHTTKWRRKQKAKMLGINVSELTDTRGKHSNHRKGKDHYRWNDGKLHTSHGYIGIAVPEGHHLRQKHGYAYEHQLVAEEMLGRELLPDEIVHHKNGNGQDNRPENLEVMSTSEHRKIHIKNRKRDKYGRITDRILPPPLRDPTTGRMLKHSDILEGKQYHEFPQENVEKPNEPVHIP